MKKIFLILLVLSVTACSKEDDELLINDNLDQQLNAVVEVDGCETEFYDLGAAGSLEVVNDNNFLYISIVANSGYSLASTKLHIAETVQGFPTVGRGNLPPGQMDHKVNFEAGVQSYTFEPFDLSTLGECFYIASQSSFTSGESVVEYWAGEIEGKSGGWSYFEYCVQECIVGEPPCEPIDLGEDVTFKLRQSTAEQYSVSKLKSVFKTSLGITSDDPEWYGTFSPTIEELVAAYRSADGGPGEYTTYYTVGTGDCTDTAKITLIVTPTL